MTIRAVLFDIGGVLSLSPEATEPAEAFDAMFARWEARQGTQGALTAYLEASSMDGQLGRVSLDAWERGLAEAGRFEARDLSAFREEFWSIYLGAWNEPLGAWLAARRPGLRAGLLSNSFPGAREREEARFGLSARFDQLVYSHEVGLAKPDRRIFELACARIETPPHEVVFVDDVPANVDAAASLGIRVVLFRATAQALRELDALVPLPRSEP